MNTRKELQNMLIYKITNNINNRVYIGQTTKTLEERIKNYYNEYKWSKNPRVIIQAMRKYGFENFNFEIIEDNIKTQKELDIQERYYIMEVYHSLVEEKGYNVECGGNSYGKHTLATKQKNWRSSKRKVKPYVRQNRRIKYYL